MVNKEDIINNHLYEPVKKKIEYDMGVKEEYCPLCKCKLYDGFYKSPKGQFNLVNANFCPNCGVQFVKE